MSSVNDGAVTLLPIIEAYMYMKIKVRVIVFKKKIQFIHVTFECLKLLTTVLFKHEYHHYLHRSYSI